TVFHTVWESCQQRDSFLQPMWDYLRINHSGMLRSPLFPVILTVASYFVLCLPFLACDIMGEKWPAIYWYKIQPGKMPTPAMLLHCSGVTLYNHLLLVLPAAAAQWMWRPPIPLPEQAPTLLELAVGVVGNLLLFDFQYFVWHLLHHRVPWLYRTFHKVHHKNTATFALTTEYSGAWETLSLGFFAAVNPMLLGAHPMTEMLFHILNMWLSVEDHCGYDFPWSTSRLIPFGIYGGPSKHDVHHRKPNTNFAPHFSHWDKLFGTHADFSFVKTH
ncbi:cholesterol 25-hydroxylase-like protein 1, partial [Triplophysa rosa]